MHLDPQSLVTDVWIVLADIAEFGQKSDGYIMLQNHHTRVWFRDLKIRPLSR